MSQTNNCAQFITEFTASRVTIFTQLDLPTSPRDDEMQERSRTKSDKEQDESFLGCLHPPQWGCMSLRSALGAEMTLEVLWA